MTTLRQLVTLIRLLPYELALMMQRWVMEQHAADVVGGEAWCLHPWHRRRPVRWPCDDFLRADREVDAILERMAQP